MKKILIIGNRLSCYSFFENNCNYTISKIWVLQGSVLYKYLKNTDVCYYTFNRTDIDKVLYSVIYDDYDILISNGCPFILPAIELIKMGKILINTHPTYLPHLRGATPLNGVFYKDYSFIGATTHYINEGIDSGNVIYQEKTEVTQDLDQGLVYFISFDMEKSVFKKAMLLLEEHEFNYSGTPINTKEGCYFNRTVEKQTIDFKTNSVEECLRKIKSFGIRSQGCFSSIDNKNYIIFDGMQITNPYLTEKYNNEDAGNTLLFYDDSFLIKVSDGILKISKYIVSSE